jgi:hypothetical protein
MVDTGQPTLTVSNATASDGSTPTYAFQVATDSGFSSIVAQNPSVSQGSQGQTSWQVSQALDGRQHFWRARARAGGTDGPFSPVADFTVRLPGFIGGSGTIQIFDPLTNGTTVGTTRRGGTFTAEGWRVDTLSDFIRYEVSPLLPGSGFVEFESIGLNRRNLRNDALMLLGMWDPTRGDYRVNPFRVHLQKRDEFHNPPYLRLRWISGGILIEPEANIIDWVPSTRYAWRIEWGPNDGGSQTTRVFINDQEVMRGNYQRPYTPARHWIELGIEERNESVIGAVYSNVRIGRR